jgi:hypothetical protein
MRRTLLVAIVGMLAVACGPGSRNSPGDDDDDNGGGDGGNQMGSNGSDDGCSDAAKLIYVVDENNKLAQFDPVSKTFNMLGTLHCPSTGQPFSMGVDRDATAYVLYNDDKIYQVLTQSSGLPCTATSWASQDGLHEFGMGYSTDMAGGTTDTLFVIGGADLDGGDPGPGTMATINTTSMSATQIATNITGRPELTGNSNAELWGWFPNVSGSMTPIVEQINKTTGAPVQPNVYMEPSLTDGSEPTAWAFGFYGGDYWVFLQNETDIQTSVYEVAGPTNTMHTPGTIVSTTPATGLTIVGAGVSTCAPTIIQ